MRPFPSACPHHAVEGFDGERFSRRITADEERRRIEAQLRITREKSVQQVLNDWGWLTFFGVASTAFVRYTPAANETDSATL